jgi:hypothetical protein
VEGKSGEALEEFGPLFVPSLIVLEDYVFLPFCRSMFMLAPLMIIASTKATKARVSSSTNTFAREKTHSST